MKLLLSNGEYFYVQQNNIKLLNSNNSVFVVGGDILYGVTEDGSRYRIDPDYDNSHLQEATWTSRVIDAVYDPSTDTYEEIYGDALTWVDTNITISSPIPSSMNSDDTFNFDNFGISLLLVFALSIFVSFRVFNR